MRSLRAFPTCVLGNGRCMPGAKIPNSKGRFYDTFRYLSGSGPLQTAEQRCLCVLNPPVHRGVCAGEALPILSKCAVGPSPVWRNIARPSSLLTMAWKRAIRIPILTWQLCPSRIHSYDGWPDRAHPKLDARPINTKWQPDFEAIGRTRYLPIGAAAYYTWNLIHVLLT